MKKFAIGLVAVALLAGCNGMTSDVASNNSNVMTPVDVPTIIPNTLDSVKLYAAKTGASAEELYNVPAHAYVVADFAHKLTPETKAKLKPWLTSLYVYLGKVRNAKVTIDNAVVVGETLTTAKSALEEAFADMQREKATQPASIPTVENK